MFAAPALTPRFRTASELESEGEKEDVLYVVVSVIKEILIFEL